MIRKRKSVTVYLTEKEFQKIKLLSLSMRKSMSGLLNPIVTNYLKSCKINTIFNNEVDSNEI